MTDFQICKNMNPIIVYLTQTETLVMLSIVYIVINHSWKCSYTATLRYFILKILGGGGSSDAPRGKKKFSSLHAREISGPYVYRSPFFIPAGLAALHENIMFE